MEETHKEPQAALSGESLATLKEILKIKWAAIEHYNEFDQKFFLGIMALSGTAAAFAKQPIGNQLWVGLLALFLVLAAIVSVLRSFIEYFRALKIITAIEKELGIDRVIGEKPSFPDENSSWWNLWWKLFLKLCSTWRISLITVYTLIATITIHLISNLHFLVCFVITLLFFGLAHSLFIVRPLYQDRSNRRTPVLSLDLIIMNEQREILLGKIAREDWEEGDDDLWGLPGREVKFRDTLLQSVQRGVKEETGMQAVSCVIQHVNTNFGYGNHYVAVGVVVKAIGELKGTKKDDSWQEWKWFSISHLPNKLFPSAKRTLKAFKENLISVEMPQEDKDFEQIDALLEQTGEDNRRNLQALWIDVS